MNTKPKDSTRGKLSFSNTKVIGHKEDYDFGKRLEDRGLLVFLLFDKNTPSTTEWNIPGVLLLTRKSVTGGQNASSVHWKYGIVVYHSSETDKSVVTTYYRNGTSFSLCSPSGVGPLISE